MRLREPGAESRREEPEGAPRKQGPGSQQRARRSKASPPRYRRHCVLFGQRKYFHLQGRKSSYSRAPENGFVSEAQLPDAFEKEAWGQLSLLFLAIAVLCVISLPGFVSRSRCPLLGQAAGAAGKSAGPGFAHSSFTQVLYVLAFSPRCYVAVCVLWGLRHRTLRSKSPQSAWLLGNTQPKGPPLRSLVPGTISRFCWEHSSQPRK